MDIFTGHYPAGGSHRQALHFRQSILNKTFQEYDFGPTENMRQYGHQEARDYDFTKIEGVPIALFCGKGDLLASPPNYLWLRDQLEEHSPDSMCFFKEYDLGHMALIIPKVRDCFDDMVALLRKYNHEGIMRPGVSKAGGQAQPCCSMF